MSEIVDVHSRYVRDLTTPAELPVDLTTFEQVKLLAGNFPVPYIGCEALTLGQIKTLVFLDLDLDDRLSKKADSDSVYSKEETYNKVESNTLLSRKADVTSVYSKEEIYTKTENDQQLSIKANQSYVEDAIGALNTDASKQYATLALANADIANIIVNQNVFVSESANGGYWYKETAASTSLTKSPYDPLTQAKTYTDTKVDAVIEQTESTFPPVTFVDEDGWFYGGFYADGSMETPLFKIANYYNDGFVIIDENGWVLLEQSTATSDAKDWTQKKILLFGDSITETSNVETGVYNSLAHRQNWLLYAHRMLEVKEFNNMARSGASYREYTGQLDWQKISHQVSIAITTGFTPDIIVIACGTNDGVANLGDYDTAIAKDIVDLNMSLTAEALRKNLYTISQAYPNAKLFSCLPLQRADVETSVRQPLLDLIRKMSGRYGFKVIDCHNETGIVRDFELGGNHRDLYDGLHPNASGQVKQAKTISASIKSSYQP